MKKNKLLIVDNENIFEGKLELLKQADLGYEIEIGQSSFDEIKQKIEREEIESAIIIEKQENKEDYGENSLEKAQEYDCSRSGYCCLPYLLVLVVGIGLMYINTLHRCLKRKERIWLSSFFKHTSISSPTKPNKLQACMKGKKRERHGYDEEGENAPIKHIF